MHASMQATAVGFYTPSLFDILTNPAENTIRDWIAARYQAEPSRAWRMCVRRYDRLTDNARIGVDAVMIRHISACRKHDIEVSHEAVLEILEDALNEK